MEVYVVLKGENANHDKTMKYTILYKIYVLNQFMWPSLCFVHPNDGPTLEHFLTHLWKPFEEKSSLIWSAYREKQKFVIFLVSSDCQHCRLTQSVRGALGGWLMVWLIDWASSAAANWGATQMRDQAANQRQPHGAAARYFTLGFSPVAVETRKNRRAAGMYRAALYII